MTRVSWQELLRPGADDDFFADPPPVAFDPRADGQLAAAWWLAELSRLVYRDRDRAGFLAATSLHELAFFDDRGSQAMLVGPRDAGDEPFVIVVFRGTDELRDWAANARADAVRWPVGGHVHRGFRRALAKVWRPLRRRLRGCPGPRFCTGHSLGGALALLAGSLLRARAVHTFGAPCAGDAAFVRTLDGVAVQRFVHGRDFVPRHDFPGFVHAGRCHHLGASGGVEPLVVPDSREDRRWSDPLPQFLDHALIGYVRAIRHAIENERS